MKGDRENVGPLVYYGIVVNKTSKSLDQRNKNVGEINRSYTLNQLELKVVLQTIAKFCS